MAALLGWILHMIMCCLLCYHVFTFYGIFMSMGGGGGGGGGGGSFVFWSIKTTVQLLTEHSYRVDITHYNVFSSTAFCFFSYMHPLLPVCPISSFSIL